MAERRGERLIIEAKGRGSSMAHTRRYGKPFTRGQVRESIGAAVIRAMAVVSREEATAGVAFPDDTVYRSEVAKIEPALVALGIQVFWAERSAPDG